MIEGPLGGAAFNNEFGRPNLVGYFRVYEQAVAGVRRGYHKPIMIAGGLGTIDARPDPQDAFPGRHAADPAGRPRHAHRHGRRRGQFDGRGRQRRRARLRFGAARQPRDPAPRAGGHQPLLGARATANPILAIHDVGAGGITNAFPELVDGAGRGARFDLRKVPLEESGLAPKEIWCNESQERYVMAIARDSAAAVRGHVRARALPVRGRRRGDRGAAAGAGRRRPAASVPSTCRWTCCWASRRRCSATCVRVAAQRKPRWT